MDLARGHGQREAVENRLCRRFRRRDCRFSVSSSSRRWVPGAAASGGPYLASLTRRRPFLVAVTRFSIAAKIGCIAASTSSRIVAELHPRHFECRRLRSLLSRRLQAIVLAFLVDRDGEAEGMRDEVEDCRSDHGALLRAHRPKIFLGEARRASASSRAPGRMTLGAGARAIVGPMIVDLSRASP